jgi:hypothetical protein
MEEESYSGETEKERKRDRRESEGRDKGGETDEKR